MYCLYNSLLVSILLVCLLKMTSSLPIVNELVKREKTNNPVLIDAINSMTAIEAIMEAVQRDTDLSDIVESISQLYQWKNAVDNFDDANSQVMVELIDLALNQSCAWVMDVIGDESFTCTSEEIALLDIKLKLGELAHETRQSLKKKSNTYYYDICEWMKQYVYCSNGPVNSIRTYIEENSEFIRMNCLQSKC